MPDAGLVLTRKLAEILHVQPGDSLRLHPLIGRRAEVEAAGRVLQTTDAQVEASEARARRAGKDHLRLATLAKQGSVSQQQLDDVGPEAETVLIELREQEMFRAAFHTL